ncbi:MAG: hypothetical protein Ta2F_17320 [Termitinemataceae bacterium]|nr:MAG: hypothetical protein Ta2F_17320 [Termitinemataceae bacterium]
MENIERAQRIAEMEKKINEFDAKLTQIIRYINTNVTNHLRDYDARLRSLEERESGKTFLPSASSGVSQERSVSAFNAWALKSSTMLPQGFFYISGEIKARAAQSFNKSQTETMWITNSDKKYLFPNPNLFVLTTNISQFYKMDVSRIKPMRGQNKIKITHPCEIEANGVINYPGELELL